jgi:hypothetical protein
MALAQENILGSFLPTVHISKITLNETRVDLELMIIDTANNELNGGVFSLINDEILRDCVVINVAQSLDAEATENIISRIGVQNPLLPSYELNTISIDDQTKFEIDEEGNKKFYYSVSFDLETAKLEHLAYSTFAEINTEALVGKYDLPPLTQEEMGKIPKKITTEIVINNFNIVSDSFVYYLASPSNPEIINTIWIGEVINVNGIYQTLESPPRTLVQVRVPNNKIQDFRIRKKIQQNTATQQFIGSVEFAINNINKFEVESANINSVLSKPRIFEEPIKYINSDGSVSLSILINMEQLIRQNCLYPSLLESDFADQIIQNMVLYRRQIKETSSNDGKLVMQEIENIVPVVIPQNFRDNKKTNIGIYSHFLLEDQQIKGTTNGKYQYGINIKFQDPTIGVLQDMLFEIIGLKKQVLEYYQFCEANIDKKTFQFKSEIKEVYPSNTTKNFVDRYIQNYKKIYQFSEEISEITLTASINSNISPVTGSLDGIFLFIKMLDDFISDISKLLSISNSTTNISNFNRADINNNSTKSNVEISKYFPNLIYDADKFTKLELKYFDDIQSAVVSEAQFYDRINKLIEPLETETLYINPKSISIYKNNFEFDLIDSTSDASARNNVYVVTKTSGTYEQEVSKAYQLIQNNKYGFIKNKIVDILANREFGADLKLIKDTLTQTSNVLVIASDLPVQVNNIIQNNIFNDYSVNLFYDEKQITPYTIGDRQVVRIDKIRDEAFIEKIIYPPTTIDTQNSSNRILEEKNNLDLNNEEEKFKYLMLNKIQYLASNNTNNNKLEWSDLTINKLNNELANNFGSIVCRMLPYDYTEFKIQNINNFLYNDYFMLDFTIELQDTTTGGQLSLGSTGGSIELGGSTGGQLLLSATTNPIELRDTTTGGQLSLQQGQQQAVMVEINFLDQAEITGLQMLEDNFEYYISNNIIAANRFPRTEADSAKYEIIDTSNNIVAASSPLLYNKINFSYSFNLSNRLELNNRRFNLRLNIFNRKNQLISQAISSVIIVIPTEQKQEIKNKTATQVASTFVANALRRNR